MNVSQQIGGSIGTSLLNTIATSAAAGYVAAHAAAVAARRAAGGDEAAVHSYDVVFWVAAAIFVGAAVSRPCCSGPGSWTAAGASRGGARLMAASAASGSPRRLRADAARNRQPLIDAAAELFAARGLDATLDDIARTPASTSPPPTGTSPTSTSWPASSSSSCVDRAVGHRRGRRRRSPIPGPG